MGRGILRERLKDKMYSLLRRYPNIEYIDLEGIHAGGYWNWYGGKYKWGKPKLKIDVVFSRDSYEVYYGGNYTITVEVTKEQIIEEVKREIGRELKNAAEMLIKKKMIFRYYGWKARNERHLAM